MAVAIDGHFYAGIAVADYATALKWYEQLFGSSPSFFAHETEAVWELAEHRSTFIEQQPQQRRADAFEARSRGMRPEQWSSLPAGRPARVTP